MKKYILIFTGAYAGFMLLTAFVLLFLDIGNFVFSMLPAVAASMLAAQMFIQNEKRVPTPQEIRSYAWLALVGSVIVSVLQVIAIMSFESADNWLELMSLLSEPATIGAMLESDDWLELMDLLTEPVAIGFMFAGLLIQYISIRWMFSWRVKASFRKLNKAIA